MKRYRLLWIVLLVLLTSCAGDSPLPISIPFLATATPTNTPIPTPTSTPTNTPTPTPTPTPTATPTPTPTPLPHVVLEAAQLAYHNGDWETAESLYSGVLPLSSVTQEEAEQAWVGLGQTLLANDKPGEAIPLLSDFLAQSPQSARVYEAHLYLADALMLSGDAAAAMPHYHAVTEGYSSLSPYASQWEGDAAYAAGDYATALAAYTTALGQAETASRQVFLWEKIALVHTASGAYDEALSAYDAILAIARISYYRARIMYQAAQTAVSFGDSAEAYARMQQLIQAYPAESYAYQALIELINGGQPVEDSLRGLIDYYADAYGPAVEAYQRVINADPEHGGEPHYYIGLSYLGSESYDLALREFNMLIETHPNSDYWGSAWIGKARALAGLGRTGEAAVAYRTLAEQLPDHPRAVEALQSAAELVLNAGQFAEAADAFLDLAERYPDAEEAPEARFKVGLLRYRAGDLAGAPEAWRSLIAWYPSADRAQAAYFWLGKTYLQAGATLSATEAFSQAVAFDTWSYYGLRAADMLAGREPFANAGVVYSVCGSPEEQRAAEEWLAGWLGLASSEGLGTMPSELLADPHLQRGTLLLRLGHFDDGRSELEALREATVGDALTQYRLALYFRDIGLYRSSIIAASSVWRLSPVAKLQDLPRFIGCLVYPTYYGDLVDRESVTLNLDPLFTYALLRQESLFEGYATSYAAAHGLMQVIPSTGQGIASSLGWPPDYETSDLYRPMVSVRFGTWYLAQQRDRIDGNLFAAMAGYNGGPGNSMRWWDLAGKDQDLFVELISFAETRVYVRHIYEYYAKYVWLYR
ncbi:MAG: tetratricopeptide repeat protein [Anaerolineae bacterium]|nr:tetratricopeptide repeat protein [Anaerolineae bacterium]